MIYLVTGSHPADLLGDDMRIEFEESVNLNSDFVNWLKWMTQTTLKKRPSSAEIALKELENPTILENNLVIAKPNGSKVKLTKKKNELEVIIPPKGFSLNDLFSYLFSFILPIFWFKLTFSMPTVSLLKIFFAIWSMFIFSPAILNSLFNMFGQTILYISQDKITLTYNLFGIKYSRPSPSSRSDISNLEIVGTTIDKTIKRHPEIPYRLIIWAGKRKYELGRISFGAISNGYSTENEYLTSPEIDWLAQELSDFLKLPISSDTVSIKRAWWEKK